MKVNQLFERTVRSVMPSNVVSYLQKLANKNIYTLEKYNESNKALSFNEWQIAKFERDFSVEVKDTDPRRIALDIKGLVALGVGLKVTTESRHKKHQVNDVSQWLDSVLKSMGWFVFRITDTYFQLDPLSQDEIAIPKKLYHMSRVENKDSILSKGILPQKGKYKNDYMYPPRVHVLLKYDKRRIFDLALQIFNWRKSTEKAFTGKNDPIPPIVIFEIDTSKLNKGTRFYHDISVEDGAWTYTHIPPQAIKIVYDES